MKQDYVWVRISLFCSKKNWNQVLQCGIQPLEDVLRLEKYNVSFLIRFNYKQGENIRLSILTQTKDAEEVAKYTDQYFKEFFREKLFVVNMLQNFHESLFMSFPENTIQYGLYLEAAEVNRQSLEIALSKILPIPLNEESINEEILLILTFYLQVCAVKIMNLYIDLAEINILNTKITNIHLSEQEYSFIERKYQENTSLIIEIFNDIMYNSIFENELLWINQWMDDCNKELTKLVKRFGHKQSTYLGFFFRINNIITDQLGNNKIADAIIRYFVKQVLTKSNN